MESAKSYILETVRQKGIRYINLWFTDVLGFLKSFTIAAGELELAFEEGIGFDGSSIEGFARIEESDMIAVPVPATFQIIPWSPKDHLTARMFVDIFEPGGRPFEGDPRYVLKKNLKRAADMGFTYCVGPEPEYFYFKDPAEPETLDKGGYFDLTPPDVAQELRRETASTLESMGIPVECSHHECAPSQHEIDLKYTDALTMADNVMTYRLVVKEVAQQRGFYATFMPKPIHGVNGSGMHVHQSLFSGEENVFFDPQDKYRLSSVAKAFIAGLLKYAPEMTSVTNQWVNSYKRLVLGFEAPVYICWARRNRSALVRVPLYKPEKRESSRVEFRSPDPACNPYLVFSVMLVAGLEGIEKQYPLPEPATNNIFQMSHLERKKAGIESLPQDLWEAIKLTENSELVKKALGERVFEYFIRNKEEEWEEYKSQVTKYELNRYLPLL